MADTAQIQEQLRDDLREVEGLEEVQIHADEPVNEDADEAVEGWVGIYRRMVTFEAGRLSGEGISSWDRDLTLVLVVQMADLQSGIECGKRLEALIEDVITAILSNTSISSTIDMVNGLSVSYSYEQPGSDEEAYYYQMATVQLDLRAEGA